MSKQEINSCDQIQQPLLDMDKALDFLFNAVDTVANTHTVSLNESYGLVLAQDIRSTINVPGFDNSSMDGYAIALSDEQTNQPGILNFQITDRIPAGSTGNTLATNCAARIFTGAPIPSGANTVIAQEECKVSADGKHIETCRPLLLNENIRTTGHDIQIGDVILQSGQRLRPQDVALIASIGISKLEVFKKIKVGIFFTGDELVEPGNVLDDGKIFSSNSYALVALLKQLNCDIVNIGDIKDDFDTTLQVLSELAQDCDLIITTGGVSVGEEDYVKSAVEKLGELTLWRIKIKPGKPLAFGRIGKSVFMGLPGNPVSAIVTFFLFTQSIIKKMQGVRDYQNKTMQVQSNFDWPQPKSRREFARVQLDYTTIPPSANLYPKQGSDVLSSVVWADGLVEIPENTRFTKGKVLDYYSIKELLS